MAHAKPSAQHATDSLQISTGSKTRQWSLDELLYPFISSITTKLNININSRLMEFSALNPITSHN